MHRCEEVAASLDGYPPTAEALIADEDDPRAVTPTLDELTRRVEQLEAEHHALEETRRTGAMVRAIQRQLDALSPTTGSPRDPASIQA